MLVNAYRSYKTCRNKKIRLIFRLYFSFFILFFKFVAVFANVFYFFFFGITFHVVNRHHAHNTPYMDRLQNESLRIKNKRVSDKTFFSFFFHLLTFSHPLIPSFHEYRNWVERDSIQETMNQIKSLFHLIINDTNLLLLIFSFSNHND